MKWTDISADKSQDKIWVINKCYEQKGGQQIIFMLYLFQGKHTKFRTIQRRRYTDKNLGGFQTPSLSGP